MKQELEVSEKLEHPHVVKVLDLCEDEDDIYIALELIKHGNLLEVLSKMERKKIPITEKHAADIIYQILLAINYIHASNIVHRDLKLENIMVDVVAGENGEANLICKVTDFGFACMMDPKKKINLSLGSPIYMAPEVIKQRFYNSKVDIWSLGVIAYIILTGKAPFDGRRREDIFASICQDTLKIFPLKKYANQGELVIDFFGRCFERDPKKRWSAAMLLNHPWLTIMAKREEVAEDVFVETALNIYTFKQSSLFQSSVIAFLVGLKSAKEDLTVLSKVFKQLDVSKDGYL